MILITGASGFIGKRLANQVGEKYGIQNLLLLTSAKNDKYPYLLHQDYNFDPNYFVQNGYEGIHTLIHAGAYTPKDSAGANHVLGSNSNIINTANLLKSNLPNLKRIVFLSTIDVYGADEVISEDTKIEPISLYGLSKYYCEQMVQVWSEQKKVECQILRIGHVYGPGEESYKKVIPITIQRLLRNEDIVMYGDGNDLRTFIYIDDVVNTIMNAIEIGDVKGPTNVTGNQNISMKELFHLLLKISGKTVSIREIATDKKGRDMLFDISKSRFLLPRELVSLEEGLKYEWNYMKSLKA